MTDLPVVVTKSGLQPRAPADIRAALLAIVAASNPGYTANLPGSLVEDISSTDVAAIAECDAALVELVNSLTPYGANAFLLNQLGQIYGVQITAATNTSVEVLFSGPPGFVIAKGFTVSDGTYQYVAQDGGIIGEDGVSALIFCVATTDGSWAVLPDTVSILVTSVPSSISDLSVTNPQAGTPGQPPQTEESYRAEVLQAGLAVAQGMATFMKTQLRNVSGVQPRLVSARQKPNNGGWEIIVGGGDSYQVAYAIFTALFDINDLVGSEIAVTGISKASPAVVTTDLNHGYVDGRSVTISDANPTQYNGTNVVTVLTEKTFSIPIDTTGYADYAGGGVCTPNDRNVSVQISDYPDVYEIPFVRPPQQSVVITLTWNTTATNFVSSASVAQLGSPALADYVNSIPVGAPINLFELQTTFQEAIASILDPQQLTRMVFAVSINGVPTSPESGTGIIAGDPESYFLTDSTLITITQG